MRTPLQGARTHTRAGFTLIELLTVVAIIGILAAILLPTVGKVRASAKNAQCVARLRQWSTLTGLASNDYKGNIPLFFDSDSSGKPIYDRYIPATKMIVESEKDLVSRPLLPWEAMTVCPTGVNGGNSIAPRMYNWVIPIGLTAKSARLFNIFDNRFFYQANSAAAPAKLLLMIEIGDSATLNPVTASGITAAMAPVRKIQSQASYIRHNGRAHALFLDGHVSGLSMSDTDYASNQDTLTQWLTLK
jgi:prepilin-type N-terminal cleavage/methylation domain-containing protein/prepilin-type processing-associated H-X9-DG protein